MTLQRTHRTLILGVILVMAFALAGCPTTPPGPTTPTPPQATMSSAVNVLAQDLDAAGAAMEAAKNQGKMSVADYNTAMAVSKVIALTGKAVDVELRSVDTWDVQKIKILNIITSSGLNSLYPRLPATAAAILAASVTAFNAISVAMGGFQL